MLDWDAIEKGRAALFDVVRTGIFSVGAVVAYVQLRESYKLRRLQMLSTLNERLGRCAKAYKWIYHPAKKWDELDDDSKYEYQNYIATFEDIGFARKLGIIGKDDFLRSYGGRYRRLIESGTLTQFMASANYEHIHFENLKIIGLMPLLPV